MSKMRRPGRGARRSMIWLQRRPPLLGNGAAGDPVTGVAGWVGLLVVRFRMDYDRRAAVAEERMAVISESDVFVLGTEFRFAIGANGEIGVIAGVVTFRILQTMLLSVGIEMRPRRLEIGRRANSVLVKVKRVFAGRGFSRFSSIPTPPPFFSSHKVSVPTLFPWASLS
jgi:hypothetical protein